MSRPEGSSCKNISLPTARIIEIEKFAERSERSFSGAASYLLKMGLVYVNDVLPDQERHIEDRVQEELRARTQARS